MCAIIVVKGVIEKEERSALILCPCLIKFADGDNYVDDVDMYDMVSGKWSTSILSQGRDRLAATSLPNLCFFAGGKSTSCFACLCEGSVGLKMLWCVCISDA